MDKKVYPPAIEAAVNCWCNELADSVATEKLEIFRETLSELIYKVFDMPEGVIEVYSKVPNKAAYVSFGKPNKPSKILLEAMKKAKIKPRLLQSEISMVISTSKVEVNNGLSDTKIIWKELLIRSSTIKF